MYREAVFDEFLESLDQFTVVVCIKHLPPSHIAKEFMWLVLPPKPEPELHIPCLPTTQLL